MQAQVLAVLRSHRVPMSAYEVLRCLREEHPRLAPPTIYRALAALTERGKAHRLESLNAFIACQCDRHHDASILSICTDCGAVEENLSTDLLATLSGIAGEVRVCPDAPRDRGPWTVRRLWVRRVTGMTKRFVPWFRLLAVGAAARLAGATLVLAALWAGFFWATSTPGGS